MTRVKIGKDLELVRMPRATDHDNYDWFDIELRGQQVGKSRCIIQRGGITICSIAVYPEFQRSGCARAVIEHFKKKYDRITADRVRYSARAFWMEMGFKEVDTGNFEWQPPASEPPARPGSSP